VGNQVIISGRRKGHLADTVAANPGMQSIELNIEDPASIATVAQKLIAEHPKLNVLINNAGIMKIDDAAGVIDEGVLSSTIATNLLGPIRMTGALIEHLKKQDPATVINVTSGLAFVPLAMTAVYSSTKAALHSYTQSMRYKLKGSSVSVLELAPPWVQTELLNGTADPRAQPLAEFIDETMKILGTDTEEILPGQATNLRSKTGLDDAGFVAQFNDYLSQSAI
jgi:uncharacterized oxidoreductase